METIEEARRAIGRQKSTAFALIAAAVFSAVGLDRFGTMLPEWFRTSIPMALAAPGLILWFSSRRAQAKLREREERE